MTKPRPRTGEPRKTHLPLKIDLLPKSARDAIESLYDRGRTWLEIQEQSAKPFSKNWADDGGGFVDWESLELQVLEQFPDMRLPKSTLQRWFDLRVSQARKTVLRESAQAREFAAAFVEGNLLNSDSAVLNALRDQIFNLIQSSTSGDKSEFIKGLQNLTLAMTRMKRVQLQEKRVAVDERRVQALEDELKLKRTSFEKETNAAADKARKGEGLTEDDINRIRERVFGLGPAPKPAA